MLPSGIDLYSAEQCEHALKFLISISSTGGLDQASVVDSPHPLSIRTTPALEMPRPLKVLDDCEFGY
jgi:hypothetical protein